jgi:mono/diheme cytochrome c family protein
MSYKRTLTITLQTILAFTLLFGSITVFAQDEEPPAEEATIEATEGADPAVIAQGETLFRENCMSCHRIHEKLVGPALKNIYDRRDMDWIKAFIKNSQAVIASGDEYAVNLYNEYNQTVMTSFAFEDEEIESIVAYIRAETEKGPETAAVATADGEVVAQGSGVPESYLNAIAIGLIFVLVLILIVLSLIVSLLVRYLKANEEISEEDKELVTSKVSASQIFKSKAFIGFATFVFVALIGKVVLDGLFMVGVQQGYAPKQPIAYSHALHAGEYEIDCNYCHTGVRKAKNANIPSANICMNCHSAIQNVQGKEGISPEIQKIYDAVESNTPIQWVRIHNLPDLAYFNHQQHVAVGGIECETCHGEIKEMVVVSQHSSLTMGWCISCHRETEVNAKGNAYYDKLVQVHEEKHGSKAALKVEDIGGLECAKCHY